VARAVGQTWAVDGRDACFLNVVLGPRVVVGVMLREVVFRRRL
jgi:hypothetical protein